MSHHFPLVSGSSGPDLLDQDSLSYNITILLFKSTHHKCSILLRQIPTQHTPCLTPPH